MKKIKCKSKNSGFTLIEIIVVIAILGVLSSIAMTKYGKAQESAKLNADYVSAANIATAANLAISDNKSVSSVSIDSLVKDGYLAVKPKPQSEDGEFKVLISNSEVTVTLGSKNLYPKNEI